MYAQYNWGEDAVVVVVVNSIPFKPRNSVKRIVPVEKLGAFVTRVSSTRGVGGGTFRDPSQLIRIRKSERKRLKKIHNNKRLRQNIYYIIYIHYACNTYSTIVFVTKTGGRPPSHPEPRPPCRPSGSQLVVRGSPRGPRVVVRGSVVM